MLRVTLPNLPADLIESIASGLELGDICSLRRTTRCLRDKVSHEFVVYFRHKHVDISASDQLDQCINMTGTGQLGCLVQRLTLKQVLLPCTDTKHDPTWAGADYNADIDDPVRRLGVALTNIRRRTAAGRLISLELAVERAGEEITIVGYLRRNSESLDNWRPVWYAARQVLIITCRALEISGLPLDELNVFSTVRRCSLAYNFVRSVPEMDLTRTLSGVKRLSLSLSPAIRPSNRFPWA
ncbi:hypothetical protein K461DRAFT_67348 [Myriangium duriaei CBS 260.36]|uniref:F-box domain-containing protein n=1 Tax=Myriangium duriaei CBS 260.36 TaxID=1168546 RepID=A0A9P4IWF1_9PEZI|nr:hypothetical protein K461DRAFT_67348 [Myriangium duriaei CBS 260.36]